MIEIGIYFDIKKDREIIERLLSFEGVFAPLIYSNNENKKPKKNLISDRKKFEEFQLKNTLGYFMYGNGVEYNVTFNSVGYSIIHILITKNTFIEHISPFFQYMIKEEGIVFCYAATEEEYEHRNRFKIQLGKNNIESWFGRDLTKHISGLYWMLYLSSTLIDKFSLNIKILESLSIEYKNFKNGKLFRLYQEPEMWKEKKEKIDDMCIALNRVFSMSDVKKVVTNNMNFQEFNAATREWR